MNLSQQTKSCRTVPKRNAFKTQNNNSAGLTIWVDVACVRENFSYSLFLQSKSFGAQGAFNLSYIKYPAIAITMINNTTFFINYFSNLILQAVLTQPANDSPSFLACCLINSNKSSSKRIVCLVLLDLSYDFLIFSCIGSHRYDRLLTIGSNHYIGKYHKKQSPEVLRALSRDLTQPLNGVMIMANRYDTAQLCARQSKLYKFYDLSTAQVVQSIAPTERQARKNLGKQSLIFIARIQLHPIVESSRRPSFNGGYYE